MKQSAIPYITGKMLGKFASQQHALLGTDGEPVGEGDIDPLSPESSQEEATPPQGKEEESMTSTQAAAETQVHTQLSARARKRDRQEDDSSQEKPPSQRAKTSESQRSKTEPDKKLPAVAEEEEEEKGSSQQSKKHKRKTPEPEPEPEDKEPRERASKRGKTTSDPETKEKGDSQADPREPQAADKPSNKRGNRRMADDVDVDDDAPYTGPRKKLTTTRDGWFVAAPVKGRKAFRRSDDAIFKDFEADARPPSMEAIATTVTRLIVKRGPLRRAAPRERTSRPGVKDFKKFRKNNVPDGRYAARIPLRRHQPNESEQMVEQQQEIARVEAEQREADALFADRSSTIRGHFKPRKRGRNV